MPKDLSDLKVCIFDVFGTVVLNNSTANDNTAGSDGGGIYSS